MHGCKPFRTESPAGNKNPQALPAGFRFVQRCVTPHCGYDAGTRNARYGGVDITISASE